MEARFRALLCIGSLAGRVKRERVVFMRVKFELTSSWD